MSKKTVKSKNSSKLPLGIALILLGLLFIIGGRKTGEAGLPISKTFENEPVKIQELDTIDYSEEDMPIKIVIPSVNIDLDVGRAKNVNGYWEVFADKAGWGDGSAVPGKIGNQVIFAHARKGLFLPLHSIKLDDIIYILTDSKWFLYKVKEIKEVYPGETEVIAPSNEEILTLYTCSGFNDAKRLIVISERT